MVVETYTGDLIAWILYDDGTLLIHPPNNNPTGIIFDLFSSKITPEVLNKTKHIKFELGIALPPVSDKLFHMVNVDTIDISNLDVSNCVQLNYMFLGVEAKKIIVGDLNGPDLRTIYGMFENAVIDQVIFRSMNTSLLEDISHMFYKSDILEIDLTGCDFSKVHLMDELFAFSTIDNLGLPLAPKKVLSNTNYIFFKNEFENVMVNSEKDLIRWKLLGLKED